MNQYNDRTKIKSYRIITNYTESEFKTLVTTSAILGYKKVSQFIYKISLSNPERSIYTKREIQVNEQILSELINCKDLLIVIEKYIKERDPSISLQILNTVKLIQQKIDIIW